MAGKRSERIFAVELYERPDGVQPAEAYILGLPERVLPQLFAFVDAGGATRPDKSRQIGSQREAAGRTTENLHGANA